MKIALLFVIVLWPATVQAECLNLKEAKKKWPDQHLSWRDDHCYYADRLDDDKKKPAAIVADPPAPVADPVQVPAPALTNEQLIQHGLTRVLPPEPPILTHELLLEYGRNRMKEDQQ